MAFLDLNCFSANLNANLVSGVFFYPRAASEAASFAPQMVASQRFRVCLRQRRTILEPRSPTERLLVQSIVDACTAGLRKPDYLKRVRCLFSSSKLLVQLRQTPLKPAWREAAMLAARSFATVRSVNLEKLGYPTLCANGILMLILQLLSSGFSGLHASLSPSAARLCSSMCARVLSTLLWPVLEKCSPASAQPDKTQPNLKTWPPACSNRGSSPLRRATSPLDCALRGLKLAHSRSW